MGLGLHIILSVLLSAHMRREVLEKHRCESSGSQRVAAARATHEYSGLSQQKVMSSAGCGYFVLIL